MEKNENRKLPVAAKKINDTAETIQARRAILTTKFLGSFSVIARNTGSAPSGLISVKSEVKQSMKNLK